MYHVTNNGREVISFPTKEQATAWIHAYAYHRALDDNRMSYQEGAETIILPDEEGWESTERLSVKEV